MPSDPFAEPTDQPLDPAQPSSRATPKTGPPGSSRPTNADLPDADAAEPIPHEHLPSRSDDN